MRKLTALTSAMALAGTAGIAGSLDEESVETKQPVKVVVAADGHTVFNEEAIVVGVLGLALLGAIISSDDS